VAARTLNRPRIYATSALVPSAQPNVTTRYDNARSEFRIIIAIPLNTSFDGVTAKARSRVASRSLRIAMASLSAEENSSSLRGTARRVCLSE
jgi:hypothetical protein